MSDEDLVRRGDVLAEVAKMWKWSVLAAAELEEAVNQIPSVQPSPDVAALEAEIAKLSDLCDCDCNDDDCVRCSHYPAILDQKRDTLARLKGGE